jgi:general stress protein YciG
MRGFAKLTPEERAAVSRKGGKAAHRDGVAYEWNSVTAKEAGRKGGKAAAAAKARAKTSFEEIKS